jgi:hypothetical protein
LVKSKIQLITGILGSLIGASAGIIGLEHESIGGFVAIVGGLWLGSVAVALEYQGPSIANTIKSLMASVLGLFVMLFGFGSIAVIFGIILYLLDNPLTKNLTYMPGSLGELIIPVLIALVLGPLAWLSSRAMRLLNNDEGAWLDGFIGAIKAPMSLLPVGFIGLAIYLLLNTVLDVTIEGSIGVAFLSVFGGIHGWAVERAVHFLE